MFHRILLIPLFAYVGWMLYLTLLVDSVYAPYLIPGVVLSAVVIVMAPQIDWWWMNRKPPKIDETFRRMLRDHLPFYGDLSLADKEEFRKRVMLIAESKDFKSAMDDETIPEDLKMVTAASLAQVSFYTKDFLLSSHEVVIFYYHPFPTMKYPTAFHLSETFDEDGVVMFSAPDMLQGFLKPETHYPIATHEWAVVWQKQYPNRLTEADFSWGGLERITGMSSEWIKDRINRPDVELIPAYITLALHLPQKFEQKAPEVLSDIRKALKIHSVV